MIFSTTLYVAQLSHSTVTPPQVWGSFSSFSFALTYTTSGLIIAQNPLHFSKLPGVSFFDVQADLTAYPTTKIEYWVFKRLHFNVLFIPSKFGSMQFSRCYGCSVALTLKKFDRLALPSMDFACCFTYHSKASLRSLTDQRGGKCGDERWSSVGVHSPCRWLRLFQNDLLVSGKEMQPNPKRKHTLKQLSTLTHTLSSVQGIL
ncbi:hypothetical protein FPV67DRAFT_634608 [Lyophyllum atratum]|nr:hypothetical protein FPV67DRAFT_634608 [Lyophyllum atratum]